MYKYFIVGLILTGGGCSFSEPKGRDAAEAPRKENQATRPAPRGRSLQHPVTPPASERVDERTAIRLAEQFVADNGYTLKDAHLDRLKLDVMEANIAAESPDGIQAVLAMRHNTLRPRAFGLVVGRSDGRPGWTVVFQSRNGDNRYGRAVTMNIDGTEVWLEHMPFILRQIERRL